MTSQIDPTLPIAGTPTTASVRANFQTAHDEITALQAGAAAITATQVAISPVIGTLGPNVQAALTTVNSNFAPLLSPNLTGNPTAPTAATGDSDTSIATTAFVQAAVAPVLHDVGRNLIHNSMFNIQQRGQGAFTPTPVGYSADRWLQLVQGGDAISTSIYAFGDAGRAVIGDEAALWQLGPAVTGTNTATSQAIIIQYIENVRRLSGKTVTVSFWATGNAALRLGVGLSQIFGTGGSPSPQVTVAGQSVAVTTTWQRFSVTLALPSSAGKTFGTANNDATGLLFWLSCAPTNPNAVNSGNVGVQSGTFFLWGVQLEIGTQATPLEKPDPQQDLAKCQRFYQGNPGVTTGLYSFNSWSAGAWYTISTTFQVRMRAAPTIASNFNSPTNISSHTTVMITPDGWQEQVFTTTTGATALTLASWTASADL
jgi:hypothetical protein